MSNLSVTLYNRRLSLAVILRADSKMSGVKICVANVGALSLARGLGIPSAWGLWWGQRVGAEEML